MAECAGCRAELPAGSRVCSACGTSAATEPGPAARRRWPRDPLDALAALVAVGGLALLVTGVFAWGVAVLLAALLVLLVRGELERRGGARALAGLRERAAAAGQVVAARSKAQMEIFRARRELAELEAERGRLLRDLGRAVFEGDESGTATLRAALGELVERIGAKEAEIDALIRDADERVPQAQTDPERRTEDRAGR